MSVPEAFATILAADRRDILAYREQAASTATKLQEIIVIDSDSEDSCIEESCIEEDDNKGLLCKFSNIYNENLLIEPKLYLPSKDRPYLLWMPKYPWLGLWIRVAPRLSLSIRLL